MSQIDRRSVVLTAATTATALGLAGPSVLLPAALAQTGAASPLNPKGLKFHKFKVGDVEVINVFDGAIMRDHNPGFIRNATVDELKASLRKAGFPDDKVANSYTVPFVRIGERTIMFDAGNGEGGPAGTGRLAENAKAAGIDLSKLSAIVVTHFHPDHIYGLMTKDNAQIYASTQIVVPEAEYDFWMDPGVIAKLPEARQGIAKRVQAAAMGSWKNLNRVAADKDAVPGVRAVATPGHSPGHTSYLIGSGSAQLLIVGDVAAAPPINLNNPGWHIAFDQDPVMAEATRRRLMDRAVADKIVCSAYHWGLPGAGIIVKDGNGYALQPVA